MKAFRNNNYVKVIFDDGTCGERNCETFEEAAELWKFIKENSDDQTVIKDYFGVSKFTGENLMKRLKESDILIVRGASVYMRGVSEQSIPQDFVEKIIEAEDKGDFKTINKYKNFWTLVSLNPDSRVRNNLFWFIRKWDMQITESGLVKAYRNAVLKSNTAMYSNEDVKNIINKYYITKYIDKIPPQDVTMEEPDGNITNLDALYNKLINDDSEETPIYTDAHSHSTTIKLGQPVKLDRDKCDANQEHSCSAGLHVGAKGWLKANYYGDVGLMVLVNPANVVAVPTIDEYGKMRVCEYFPVAIVDFDENGNVVEPPYDVHTDVEYLNQIAYEGVINNNDVDNYEIQNIHRTREDIYASILARLEENEDDD